MRVLCTVFGARPHLYPLVPIAWAARAAGHEVRLATTPKLASDAVDTGLPTVIVGGPPDVPAQVRQELADDVFSQQRWPADWVVRLDTLDDRKVAHLRAVGEYLVAVAAAMVDDLVSFARDWAPDLVVYDSFSYAGPVAAAAAGVPGVRHLSGTDSAQRLELLIPGRAPLPEYARLFQRFDLPVVVDSRATVEPTPPSLRLVTSPRLLPMRFVPYNGSGLQPNGLDGARSRPRICVTWGHTIADAGGVEGPDPYRTTIEAIAAAGLSSLVVTTAAELDRLGPLPRGARGLASVPLHLVLPHCDAIVHQGGDGTVLTAATAALPQLVIAGSPEAGLIAGRLAAAGAGIHLWHHDLRGPAGAVVIRHAIDAMLHDSGYRRAAERLRAEIEQQPAPADVIPDLVAIANGVAARRPQPARTTAW